MTLSVFGNGNLKVTMTAASPSSAIAIPGAGGTYNQTMARITNGLRQQYAERVYHLSGIGVSAARSRKLPALKVAFFISEIAATIVFQISASLDKRTTPLEGECARI